MSTITIRRIERADLTALLDIYNYYVVNTPITFDLEPRTLAQRQAWFDASAGEDIHRVYGVVTQLNNASNALHVAFSFRLTGTQTEVGRKTGRFWDVALYEKPMP